MRGSRACRAFSSDQYGPKMRAAEVRDYMAAAPKGAQRLVDAQREMAARFGPASLAFQDWLGVHAGRLALFVTRQAADRACHAAGLFNAAPGQTLRAVLDGAALSLVSGYHHATPQHGHDCLHLPDHQQPGRDGARTAGRLVSNPHCAAMLCTCDPLGCSKPWAQADMSTTRCATCVTEKGRVAVCAGTMDLASSAQAQGERAGRMVRKRIPRIPLFLLPPQLWHPLAGAAELCHKW